MRARWRRRLLLAAAGVLGLALWYFNLLPIAFHWLLGAHGQERWRGRSLGLGGYTVAIEARPIRGLSANTSGLTFNADSGTLMAVINRPPAVAELSTQGELLRLMPLRGLQDPEGITHVEGDLFVIADEAHSRLHWVRIGPRDTAVDASATASLRLDLDPIRNLGFEGVSWDGARSQLLVASEKWPRRVLAVQGFAAAGGRARLSIGEWRPTGWAGLLGSDLSSLTVHEPTGNLLLLSEESAVLTEYSRDGEVIGLLPLWRGLHGLAHKIPQPEGVAIGPDTSLYIVSEPNLFYRFDKPHASADLGQR